MNHELKRIFKILSKTAHSLCRPLLRSQLATKPQSFFLKSAFSLDSGIYKNHTYIPVLFMMAFLVVEENVSLKI